MKEVVLIPFSTFFTLCNEQVFLTILFFSLYVETVSGTTNTILRETKFFQSISKNAGSLTTIAGNDTCIIGSGRATIILPMVTIFT